MGNEFGSSVNQNFHSAYHEIRNRISSSHNVASIAISYSEFVSSISFLNKFCQNFTDEQGFCLFFYIKKGTDSSLLWKTTVRVGCVEVNTRKEEVLSFRLLNLRHYIQVFATIMKECRLESSAIPDSPITNAICVTDSSSSGASASSLHPATPLSIISTILGEPTMQGSFADVARTNDNMLSDPGDSSEDECSICLERKQDVILPCCHAYCTPCIEQWWIYCQEPTETEQLLNIYFDIPPSAEKSCPLCRKSVDREEDTWVLSEAPNEQQIRDELRKIIFKNPSSVPEEAGPLSLAGPSSRLS